MQNTRRLPTSTRFSIYILLALLCGTSMSALNERTHRLVNRQAARIPPPAGKPSIDEYLRSTLGFKQGLNTLLRKQGEQLSIEAWLEGS